MFRDNIDQGRGLPRSLLDIDRAWGYQSSASATPNPDLRCQGCPTTDTRTQVTDTTVAPWDAVGLLAREEQQALSAEIAQVRNQAVPLPLPTCSKSGLPVPEAAAGQMIFTHTLIA